MGLNNLSAGGGATITKVNETLLSNTCCLLENDFVGYLLVQNASTCLTINTICIGQASAAADAPSQCWNLPSGTTIYSPGGCTNIVGCLIG